MEQEIFTAKDRYIVELPNELFIRLCYLSIAAQIPIDELIGWAVNEYLAAVEDNPSLTRQTDKL